MESFDDAGFFTYVFAIIVLMGVCCFLWDLIRGAKGKD
jgi:hypothetical protein